MNNVHIKCGTLNRIMLTFLEPVELQHSATIGSVWYFSGYWLHASSVPAEFRAKTCLSHFEASRVLSTSEF